jgi:hypothetical protein
MEPGNHGNKVTTATMVTNVAWGFASHSVPHAETHVKCPISTEVEMLQQISRKLPDIKFHEHPFS